MSYVCHQPHGSQMLLFAGGRTGIFHHHHLIITIVGITDCRMHGPTTAHPGNKQAINLVGTQNGLQRGGVKRAHPVS